MILHGKKKEGEEKRYRTKLNLNIMFHGDILIHYVFYVVFMIPPPTHTY